MTPNPKPVKRAYVNLPPPIRICQTKGRRWLRCPHVRNCQPIGKLVAGKLGQWVYDDLGVVNHEDIRMQIRTMLKIFVLQTMTHTAQKDAVLIRRIAEDINTPGLLELVFPNHLRWNPDWNIPSHTSYLWQLYLRAAKIQMFCFPVGLILPDSATNTSATGK